MNLNKKIIKKTAITAVAVTVLVSAGFQIADAAEQGKLGVDSNQIVTVAENTVKALAASDIDHTAFKDETVYVMADANGATKKIIVSDWLKNANASLGLSDISILNDITNVKGYETFEASGSDVTWNAQGNDIYYQGTSDAQLPVTVKVIYKLDGVEMTPQELVGKSGKLTVRYEYTNLLKNSVDINGKKEDIYTPILMLTGAILPSENYRNIEVENGKIVSDGNNQMVVGISLPGLTDSLKVDSDKITVPEYFEYTADVTDYSVGTSMSVGVTNVFDGLDINGDDIDLNDIQDKIDELVDGVDQLVDGSGKLYDGLKTLQSKTGEFKTGVNTLSSSLTSLQDALKKLNTGANSLDSGAKSLSDGAKKLSNGIDSAKAGMDKIVSNYSAVTEGASKITTGIKSASTGIGQLESSLKEVNKTYDTLDTTVANDEAIIAGLKQVNAAYKDPTIEALIQKLEANTAGQKKIAAGLSDAGDQLVAGTKTLSAGAKELEKGMSSLSTGIGALSQGSTQVQSGLKELSAGGKNLVNGADQLADGTKTLSSSTKQLQEAGNKLANGGSSLLSATDQLTSGIGKLVDGSSDLNDGVKKLRNEGIDKIVDIVDGDLTNVVERFKAVINQSYKNYSGIGEDMDGNVKFVIKYEDDSEQK